MTATNSNPLVSIVIPCFNSGTWIASTIKSALDQSYSRIEVIVVDDGSTDNSREQIEKFGSSIRAFFTKNNGACAARNFGLEQSQGTLVQFLDADDLMTPDCVARKLEFRGTQNFLSCCDVRLMDLPSNSSATKPWDFRFDLVGMLRYGAPQTSVPLHDRNQLSKIGGFRAHLPCAQDYDLHLRLKILCDADFRSNRHVGVLIRPIENSLSRSAGIKMPKAKFDVLTEAARLLDELGKFDFEPRNAIACHMTAIARTLWSFGDRKMAKTVAHSARMLSTNCYQGCYRNSYHEYAVRIFGFANYERIRGFYGFNR